MVVQPKRVRIKDCTEARNARLKLDDVYDCVIQERDEDDTSRIVYIANPWYQAGDEKIMEKLRNGDEVSKNTHYLSFTESEYEVIEMYV